MSFNLIVTLYKNYKPSSIPSYLWESDEYTNYLRKILTDGIIVIEQKLYDFYPKLLSICIEAAAKLVIITPSTTTQKNTEIITYCTISQFVPTPFKKLWIMGGFELYKSFINQYDKIYIISVDHNLPESVGRFMPIHVSYELIQYVEPSDPSYKLLEYKRNASSPNIRHERQHLMMIKDILDNGNLRTDRTGTGTISMFGRQMRYMVRDYLPILTTKFVPITVIIKELLWFLRGETDVKILQKQGVHIWDGNSSREYLDKIGLTEYEDGDMGCGYGFQWRHFGAEYEGCSKDYTSKGFDQIAYIISELKTNPFSRRLYFTAWNASQLSKMALPPCHVGAQFYVEKENDGTMSLSIQFYQRSQDVFLATNFNLVSYTILLYIIAKKVHMVPKEVIHTIGDTHIYTTHIDKCKMQLTRQPLPQPQLKLCDTIETKKWEEISVDDFKLIGYFSYPPIQAKMAI